MRWGPIVLHSNWRTTKITEISRNVWDNGEGWSERVCQQMEGQGFVKGRIGCPGNVISNFFSAFEDNRRFRLCDLDIKAKSRVRTFTYQPDDLPPLSCLRKIAEPGVPHSASFFSVADPE